MSEYLCECWEDPKCPHGCYKSNNLIKSADELAKAARDAKRLCPVEFKDDIVLGNIWFALSAYEKARGLK